MTQAELIARWEERRNAYLSVAALVEADKLIAEFLSDVRGLTLADANRVLTLKSAAAESGYSTEHLARLIRDGRIRNAGRRYAPRVYAIDLPVRRTFAAIASRSYDVDTDARTLRNGRQ